MDKTYQIKCDLESKEIVCGQRTAQHLGMAMAMRQGLKVTVSVKGKSGWLPLVSLEPSQEVQEYKAQQRKGFEQALQSLLPNL